jgi:hypothetical protein
VAVWQSSFLSIPTPSRKDPPRSKTLKGRAPRSSSGRAMEARGVILAEIMVSHNPEEGADFEAGGGEFRKGLRRRMWPRFRSGHTRQG